MMHTENLLVELLVEELPPKALKKLGEAFAASVVDSLQHLGLARSDALVTSFASPRRLAVHVTGVAARAVDRDTTQKLMPVSVGLDGAGQATPALLKKLQALGADASAVAGLKRAPDGKAEALFYDSTVRGVALAAGLQIAIDHAIAKLPVPKLMSYQLEGGCELPGWSSVSFVRPAHGLVAMHGSEVVAVHALGLQSGNATQGHRFEARVSPVVFGHADSYAATMAGDGAVIAGFADRRAEIVRLLTSAADKVGGGCKPIDDAALLDEVTGLVERPNVLICEFEKEFLEVPQECLILTMKANQKYFPLLDVNDKLTHKFLVVSNITPDDASLVVGGNERVVRPRLSDAKFFFDQDRKKTLASRVEALGRVVYHNKLGTQGERVERVRAIAKAIAALLGDTALMGRADQAALLAKADLLTDMVGEFPELQGTMGGYYARNDGLDADIAHAIEDHYKPRFAGDSLPRNEVGLVVALADKLETLVGMFGIGNLPTGDKDPFALRRHALGVIRILAEPVFAAVEVEALLDIATRQFSTPTVADFDANRARADLLNFLYDRFFGALREQGYSAPEVDAVLSQRPQRLGDVGKRLTAVRAFASLPEAAALAAANKRIGNILKKALDVDAHVSELLLALPAEKALYSALKTLVPGANAQFEAGDYAASLQTLAALRAPVDAFFDGVMVNAEEMDLRLNRQGLLKSLHDAMNRVADLSKLAG